MDCPVCDRETEALDAANLSTSVHVCRDCDLYCRPLVEDEIDDWLSGASYTDPAFETRYAEQRTGFFERILDSISMLPQIPVDGIGPLSLLDFGSSYGHLIDMASSRGYDAVGVERNAGLLERCRRRGLTVASDIQSLAIAADVATMIDSLYYVPRPRDLLTDLKDVLLPGSWVVVRLTNRNPVIRIRNRMSLQPGYSLLGDAVVSYSPRAARRLFELQGYRVKRIEPDTGAGKRLPLMKTALYVASAGISSILPEERMLTPGFFLYARLGLQDGP